MPRTNSLRRQLRRTSQSTLSTRQRRRARLWHPPRRASSPRNKRRAVAAGRLARALVSKGLALAESLESEAAVFETSGSAAELRQKIISIYLRARPQIIESTFD